MIQALFTLRKMKESWHQIRRRTIKFQMDKDAISPFELHNIVMCFITVFVESI